MNGKSDKLPTCPECGSQLLSIEGVVTCSQNVYDEYTELFINWDSFPKLRLGAVRKEQIKLLDLYEKWQNVDDYGNRPSFCCEYDPLIKFDICYQTRCTAGDPVQLYIAERLINRKLNYEEFNGIVDVPLINELGIVYWGKIDQLQFPTDFYSRIKPKKAIMGIQPDLEPIFRWEYVLADYHKFIRGVM